VAPDDVTGAGAAGANAGLMDVVGANLVCGSLAFRSPVDGDELLFATLGPWKASFAARVSATVLATVYHAGGSLSFGLPSSIKEMRLWMEGSRPQRNFITIARPSVYSAFSTGSSKPSMYSSIERLLWWY
jgi:hypothetical protein